MASASVRMLSSLGRRGDPPGTGAVRQKNFDGITDARHSGPSYNSGCYTDGALALLRQIQYSFGRFGADLRLPLVFGLDPLRFTHFSTDPQDGHL